jgi:hypothetical protein
MCLLNRNGWGKGWPGCGEEKGAYSCYKLNSDHPADGQLFHLKTYQEKSLRSAFLHFIQTVLKEN